jgi:hypothetical protein
MNILGKYEVIKVLSNFDENMKPVYVSKEEALTLDNYKDAQSANFISSTYILKEDSLEIIAKILNDDMRKEAIKNNLKFLDDDTVVFQGLKAIIEDGKYYVFDPNNEADKVEIKQSEDGTITFMMLLVLKKVD